MTVENTNIAANICSGTGVFRWITWIICNQRKRSRDRHVQMHLRGLPRYLLRDLGVIDAEGSRYDEVRRLYGK
ncbi:MAG: hypothetical protein ACR2PF_10455 [Rhizobiaceae bacterium]